MFNCYNNKYIATYVGECLQPGAIFETFSQHCVNIGLIQFMKHVPSLPYNI